jgi:hypothetical protein
VKGLWAAVFLSIVMSAPAALAQGCSLCRDTTAGSAPKAREGLRRGILVLGIPAGALFVGILVLAWKIKPD